MREEGGLRKKKKRVATRENDLGMSHCVCMQCGLRVPGEKKRANAGQIRGCLEKVARCVAAPPSDSLQGDEERRCGALVAP